MQITTKIIDIPLAGIPLTGDDVFAGLLDYGLFSEKMPPCFSSKGLAEFVKKNTGLINVMNLTDEKLLKNKIDSGAHDFIRYESVRDVNIPRPLGVPHPESYAYQVCAIQKHWDEILKHTFHLKVSRIHVRHVGGGRIFEMNYKGNERFELEEDEIGWMAGATFLVKADISKCFHSIYTHSIPWALNGRGNAKAKRGLLELSGNLLDNCTRNLRDKQTNGLLIGPHSSNIISEIVLTAVDQTLIQKGYKKLKRHIDDYEFYADSYDEAEKFLHDLGLALREYELNINEKKTTILPLPRPSTENWVRELNRFSFPLDEDIKFLTVRSFLDLALDLARAANTSAPLNYAIKMIPERLNDRAKRLYVQEAINLSLAFPYLAPLLDEHVFTKYAYSGIDKKIGEFNDKILRLGIKKLHPDAIAYGLYYSFKYGTPLKVVEEKFGEIIELDDCLVSTLLWEYAGKHGLNKIQSAIKKRTDNLKHAEQFDIDRQWLLIYQIWSDADLVGNGQGFLAELKKAGFSFFQVI